MKILLSLLLLAIIIFIAVNTIKEMNDYVANVKRLQGYLTKRKAKQWYFWQRKNR